MEGESIIEDWGEDEFLDGGDILEEMPDNDNAVISDEEHDDEAMEGQIEGNPPMIAQDDSIQGFFENQGILIQCRVCICCASLAN